MKVVIEITKEMYQVVQDGMWCGSETWYNALKNGTPLPKRHGRLIDADALLSKAKFLYKGYEIALTNTIGDAPTIIEAESEGDT